MVEVVYSRGRAMYTVDDVGNIQWGSGHIYSRWWRLYTVRVKPCIQWTVEDVYSRGGAMYTVDDVGYILWGSGHVYSRWWRLYTVGVRPCI